MGAPGGDAVGLGNVARVCEVHWLCVRSDARVVGQGACLGEGAGEDGAEGELVDVAVVPWLAGNLDQRSVAVAGGGVCKASIDSNDEGRVVTVDCRWRLLPVSGLS